MPTRPTAPETPEQDPASLGAQLGALRRLLGLSQTQVAEWIRHPLDPEPPVRRIQHWEHNRRRPRTRQELLVIATQLRRLNPTLITPERIERLFAAYAPQQPLTAEERAALFATAGAAPAANGAAPARPERVLPCPYRGLLAFREEDAPVFHGREAFTRRLAAAAQEGPLVAVLGPSGSGKSSVVFAGLLPRLRAGGEWTIAVCRPGDRPFHAVAAALLPLLTAPSGEVERLLDLNKLAAGLEQGALTLRDVACRVSERAPAPRRLLLVIDQFEELYTLCRDPATQRGFLDALLTTVRAERERAAPACTLVITLRADFLGYALAYRPFADALQDADLKLGPMTPQELEAAIEGPAHHLEVQIEEGLTTRLVDAVGTEPGNLPLLEFALTLLWARRSDDSLTHAAYEEIGGVGQALARYAEEVYNDLRPEEHPAARRVFTQLVRPGEGTADTRRRARRADLPEADWDLVSYLADARLVTTGYDEATGEETVEIVHEALIAGWERLREWVESDRKFRTWQEHLRAGLREWAAGGEDDSALPRGARLAAAEGWLRDRAADLSEAERAYISAGLRLRRREEEAQEAARRRETEQTQARTRQTRRYTRLLVVLAVGLVGLLALAAWLTHEAQGLAQANAHRLRLAQAQTLAAQAVGMLEHDPELGVLLAMEAVSVTTALQETPVAAAEDALHLALLRSPLRATLRGHTAAVTLAVYSPDGRRIVTTSDDGTARVWDAGGAPGSDPPLLTLRGHSGAVLAAAVSPSGRRIATAGADGTVRIWDAAHGAALLTLRGHTGAVYGVAYNPAQNQLATAGADGTARVWDAITGRELRVLHAGQAAITSVIYNTNGQTIATGHGEGSVVLWDAATGLERRVLRGHTAAVYSLAFSPDRRFLATAGDDATIRIWDVATGMEQRTLFNGRWTVRGVAYSPDGRSLVTASWDYTAQVWDPATGQPRLTLRGHAYRVSSAVFSPDGRQILTASEDGTAKIWDAGQQPEEYPTLRGAPGTAWSAAYSPDGRQIVTAHEDRTAKIWDAAGGHLLLVLAGHTNEVVDAAFSPDGRWVVTAGADGTARIWDSGTGRERATLAADPGGVSSAAFSPDGRRVVTAGSDGTAKIWDVAGVPGGAGQLLHVLRGHSAPINTAAYSPDGRQIVTAGTDGTVQVWDAGPGPARLILDGAGVWMRGAAFSPDGRQVVAAGWDGRARIWAVDAPTGLPRLTLVGHTQGLNRAAFSPDGRQVVTAGADGTARVWDVTAPAGTGQERVTLRGHTDRVWTAAYSPDGRRIVTASRDGSVRQHIAPLADLLALARARVTRTLTPEERTLYVPTAPPTGSPVLPLLPP